jgi:hypothetical protein
MFQQFYQRVTAINLTPWIIAYIATIALYTVLPESIPALRQMASLVAQLMLGLIFVAAIDRMRKF